MSASFRSIVQQVTQEKLEELKIQKDLTTNHFHPVLKRLAEPTIKPEDALQILYEAITDNPIKDLIDSVLVENLKYVLQNAKDDPSISSQLVLAWVEKMKQEIQYSLRRCEYSYLYGSLLSEWLDLEERKGTKKTVAKDEAGLDATSLTVKVDMDKHAATEKIKALMFKEFSSDEFDQEKFRKFLSEELFQFEDNAEGQSIMKDLRKETEEYFKIDNYYISSYDVQCCIKGLRSQDLLSLDKKEALKELSDNPEALDEVASLLTNRLKNLSRWEWPSSCESVEIRRGLAGEYKPFINEDIITALFLQYVGVQWASYFKRQFMKLYQSKVWIKAHCLYESIESQRNRFHGSTFLSSLPDSMESQDNKLPEEYVKIEENAMDYAASRQLVSMSSGLDDYPPPESLYGAGGFAQPGVPRAQFQPTSAIYRPKIHIAKPRAQTIDFKQEFLHSLSTEIRLHQVIRSDKPLVVLQADLESFGPSLIHDAVLTVLEYLGVTQKWIDFFEKFLQPKVCFADNGEKAKTICRGVPTSHALSSLFGETLLFLLDFLINQKCNGMRIYRIADEFWFWSDVTENVTKAWETMNTYGKMVGLKIKENRSGSVSIYSDEILSKLDEPVQTAMHGPAPLPQRNIHWGYLQLHSNGTFKIDVKSITKFHEEMRGLLEKSECVLEWINVFNKYMTFFIRNFGKSALVSGKQHLDQIISSLQMIYSGLFGSDGPVEKLKARFEKLKSADIVDVWMYWPLEKGGLGLINPFVGIMSLRETYADINDDDHFKKLPLQDKEKYDEIKKEYERRYGTANSNGLTTAVVYPGYPAPEKLPTWEEYLAKRETELSHWYYRYVRLLEHPGPKAPNVSDRFWKLDSTIPNEEEKNYMMWLFAYYETQLILHFGSVKFINSKLLPMSMIANIQKTKVQH